MEGEWALVRRAAQRWLPRGDDRGVEAAAARALAILRREGARALALGDPGYPSRLLDLRDPPRALFLMGSWSHPGPVVCVVGARRASGDGVDVTRWLVGALAEHGVAVLSGLARGVDAAAHAAALEAGGVSGAVMGTGFDDRVPRDMTGLKTALASSLGLMSEVLPGLAARPAFFAMRNRLLAALADGVVVVQGRSGSGSLLAAEAARRLGRPVGAVPWDCRDPLGAAPHALLRAGGATLIRGPQDVLELIGRPATGSASPPPHATVRRTSAAHAPAAIGAERAQPLPSACDPLLDANGRLLLSVLRYRPEAIDRVAARAGLSIEAALAALMLLEIAGHARREPGGAVCRTRRA